MSVNETDAWRWNESAANSAALHHSCSTIITDDHRSTVVKFEEVSAAAFKIQGAVERTPCNVSEISKTSMQRAIVV